MPGAESRYRHYRNYGRDGDVVYITTTCLDFAHLLRRPEMKDLILYRLAHNHIHYGSVLHAFVIMSNHIHLISRVPDGASSSWFVQRLKTNTARELAPLLTSDERAELRYQAGLDGRRFWKRGFDSLVIEKEKTFWQKVIYIHDNPVRASLVPRMEDYRWSSARLFVSGQ